MELQHAERRPLRRTARRPGTDRSGPGQLSQALGWFSIGLGAAQLAAPERVSRWIGLAEDHSTLMRALGLRELTSGIGILKGNEPRWLWSRVAGDAMDLLLLGAALASDRSDRRRVLSAAVAVFGVATMDVMAARGLNGNGRAAVREQAITVGLTPEEVYRFWRNFENLPRFMRHLEQVQVIDEVRSHWVAVGPAGTRFEWDAEVTEDRPGRLLRWRSLPGADIENYGTVWFTRAPGDRGTEIHVRLIYHPPMGALGAAAAKLFGEEPGQQIKGDLARLKQVLETGEVVHSDSSIHRGMHPAQPPTRAAARRIPARSAVTRRSAAAERGPI
jgi:uncharacterized membrane protein